MKILQVNCVYQKGSTGKIIYDIHKCLQAGGNESVVCYGRGKEINELNVYKFCTELESKLYHLMNKFGWLMYSVCPVATRRLICIIKNERPDIVHLHCINGYCVNIYSLLRYLGESNIKTVITHHAEFFYTGNCGHAYECDKFQQSQGCHDCPMLKEATGSYLFDRTNKAWRSMKKAFSFFKKENLIFTAVSPWVVNRSALSPICNGFECKFVTNGLETSIFHPVSEKEIDSIKTRLPHGRKIILHVTASFTTDEGNIKGGYYIKRLAEIMPQYLFIIVTSKIGNIKGLPDNILMWGSSRDQKELAILYSLADVTVIASKRETFSMIVAESLCCGTPIVGFKAGGPESIGLNGCSNFVDYGDINALQEALVKYSNIKWDRNAIAQHAKHLYSKESMTEDYLKIYKQLLK